MAEDVPAPTEPVIAGASDEAQHALQGFKIPSGLEGSVFAAEPLIANPVSFYVDHQGRVYVCESFRQNAGVTDNRGHDEAWLNDDLAAQTVEDRLEYHKKHLKQQISEYVKHDDRIRLLIDKDGDGRADDATVFANGFNQIVDGTGAGVLEHRGNVFFTCIPHLWLLRDENQDGIADYRKALHSGFGVRVAFRGHDLHGLILGPDGRVYFSIGDRGYSIPTAEGRLHDPESGAVFRCELDGSNLEVFATGLRNPQELAFDDYGNLFTGDNNSDSGDRARWVYVVRGGDSGWRMAYQYLPDRGPFNRERIWHPYHPDQPAYIVPPVTNFADGPSGLAYYPGTGLSDHFRGRFLLCDFRGGPANSGVRSFRVKRHGAFFELTDEEQPFWNILATDVQFGPDGAIYLSDWVNGWNGEGKGRLYRFADPTMQQSPLVQEVRNLLRSGVGHLAIPELINLLAHADRRIRLEAQFELAQRGSAEEMLNAARGSTPLLGRLHALWGLGQLNRRHALDHGLVVSAIESLLDDVEPEVRAHSIQLLGELGARQSIDQLVGKLTDDDHRVRYYAAMALAELQATEAFDSVIRLLEDNADRDPIVRHGGVTALAVMKPDDFVARTKNHESASVRRAAVVALRKRRDSDVAAFLGDSDALVVTEAARAIHDLPLDEAMPALANLVAGPLLEDSLWRRVLNANLRIGGPERASAVAAFAARSDVPDAARLEALDILASWEQPSSRDRVLGMWRPVKGSRSKLEAAAALEAIFESLSGGPQEVRVKAAQLAGEFGLAAAVPALESIFDDGSQPPKARADAVLRIAQLQNAKARPLIERAMLVESPVVRAAARRALAQIDPELGVEELSRAVTGPSQIERQSALAALGELNHESSTAAIRLALEQLLAGKIPPDTQLDVLEAAKRKTSPEVEQLVEQFYSGASDDDPVSRFRETLVGGDAQRGERIFFDRTDLSCVRCHKINGRGGDVGPDLSRIAADKDRKYLLESVIAPNRAIAKGFDSVVIVDADGKVHVGVLREENEREIRIVTAEGQVVSIATEDVEDRAQAKSPMPEDLAAKISKTDLRDLVEYLASLK